MLVRVKNVKTGIETHLSFAVTPEIDDHADEIVDGGVCALIDEGSAECRKWNDGQPELKRAVKG